MGEFEICWRLGAFYPTGCTFIIYIYAFTFTKQSFHNILLYYVMRKEQKHLQAAHNGIDVDNSVNFGGEIHLL